jgi:hypothetical protein
MRILPYVQQIATRRAAVSIEIMRTLSMESALEIVTEAAQALQLADFEDVIAKLEDEDEQDEQASLAEDKMADEMAIDTPEDDTLADWEKVAITEEDTGTSSDAESTARQYRHANQVWNTFQAQGNLSEHKLSSKEL